MKPPKRDQIGDRLFGPSREVSPISEVFLQIHCRSLQSTTQRQSIKIMNFTKTGQYAWPFLPVMEEIIFFEAAKILYLSYRASLILVNSDAWGAFLECTLLPGALVT